MENYGFTTRELRVLGTLNTPAKIQDFIDGLPYDHDEESYRSPRWVLRTRRANCFEGAIFAAAARRVNGHEPLVIELRAVRDESHALCVYRVDNLWGAIGKSKFVGLRYREPIFKSIRELALSYFEFYYNYAYQKTLRKYSILFNLKVFDELDWMTTEKSLKSIGEHLGEIPHYRILPKKIERRLRTVDSLLFERGIIERKKS